MNTADLENLVINCIRTLSMDAVQKANSGHPGTPMALAPVAFKLWDKFITHNPGNPNWPNRDRFVLSAGHASMLLYSVLHIYGYEVSLEEIKNFRQLHSKCAGHPEFGSIRARSRLGSRSGNMEQATPIAGASNERERPGEARG